MKGDISVRQAGGERQNQSPPLATFCFPFSNSQFCERWTCAGGPASPPVENTWYCNWCMGKKVKVSFSKLSYIIFRDIMQSQLFQVECIMQLLRIIHPLIFWISTNYGLMMQLLN